ncbi:hypothetical protein, partial [Rhodococcus sp. KBW08]|uniref:hypothetical protein n=1 Tax=Rhodococcus sp. KBW08 TaxID=2144188 RepID=UPI001C89E8DB
PKARNIIRHVKYQNNFGTDIHRHTVEFSKNTHTPSPQPYGRRSGATFPAYPIMIIGANR